jgi:hypothetical protein
VLLFEYVEIELGDRKISVKEVYAEEIQSLINDIVILSKMHNQITIKEINDENTTYTMYGYAIKINEKDEIYFEFNSTKPSYSKDVRDKKIIDSFYCDYSVNMKQHFMFKNDFTIQQKKANNSLRTLSFATMIKILDKIKEVIINL